MADVECKRMRFRIAESVCVHQSTQAQLCSTRVPCGCPHPSSGPPRPCRGVDQHPCRCHQHREAADSMCAHKPLRLTTPWPTHTTTPFPPNSAIAPTYGDDKAVGVECVGHVGVALDHKQVGLKVLRLARERGGGNHRCLDECPRGGGEGRGKRQGEGIQALSVWWWHHLTAPSRHSVPLPACFHQNTQCPPLIQAPATHPQLPPPASAALRLRLSLATSATSIEPY